MEEPINLRHLRVRQPLWRLPQWLGEEGDAGRRRRRPEPYSGSALGDALQPIAISHHWHHQRHGDECEKQRLGGVATPE